MKVQGEFEELSLEQLLAMFRHWDGIEAQKELLYITISFGALGAVAASWDKNDAGMVLSLSLGSIALYAYYLLTILRFQHLQNGVFNEIIGRCPDFKRVLWTPPGAWGVKLLRPAMLPALAGTWASLIYLKALSAPTTLGQQQLWTLIVGSVIFFPCLFTLKVVRNICDHQPDYNKG